MSKPVFSPSRRAALGMVAAGVASSLVTATGFYSTASATPVTPSGPGPLTYYAELRVAPPFKAGFDEAMQQFASTMRERGALAVTLKEVVGESTMIKHYPETYKGVLRNAYSEAVEEGLLPLSYSLFVRFASRKELESASTDTAFDTQVLPHLHGAMQKDGKVMKSPSPMAVYRGLFHTVAAGDRQGVYTNQAKIVDFLANPADAAPDNTLTTVENHVSIADQDVQPFEQKVLPLVKVAQNSFRPKDAANGIGQSGGPDNHLYRMAVSTEIMRKATPDGDLRAYIMHGIWESVWDHENSHFDPRFKAAEAGVGTMIKVGPVEPFYTTRLTVLKR